MINMLRTLHKISDLTLHMVLGLDLSFQKLTSFFFFLGLLHKFSEILHMVSVPRKSFEDFEKVCSGISEL